MTPVEWVDELPERRNLAKPPAYGYEALDELKANPGKWAKLHTYEVSGSASSAKNVLVKKGYEAETRGGVLYARWPEQDVEEPTPLRRNPSARPKSRGNPADPYECEHCPETFTTPAAVLHHNRRRHPDEMDAS